MRISVLFFTFFIVSGACAESVIPITMANLQGQKNLFEKGWYVVVSPIDAYEYALKNGESSKKAWEKAMELAKKNSDSLTLKESIRRSQETMLAMKHNAHEQSNRLNDSGRTFSEKLSQKSEEDFKAAWKKLNLGYLQYSTSNREDLENLVKVNREFFPNIKQEFKTMDEAALPVLGYFFEYQEVNWKKYFKEGQYAFEEQYQKSGTRSNSLAGLWDVLVGYGKFLYSSVIKTSAHGTSNLVKNSGYYTTSAVLRSYIVAHSTVYSLGANFYYSSKLGYRLISPSVEAGLLSSMALINAAAAPTASLTLKSAGLINKVAINAVAPVVGGGEIVISQIASKATNSALYLSHGAAGAGEVLFETMESGVVLGYSALSQLPPQLLLSAANSAVFLVVDGPKLMLMGASGILAGKNIWELPSGAVMDMKKLKEAGIELRPLSEDPRILKQVLQYAN
ncbi:hypothetical protein ACJVC5_13120 [Peredibacter sp. HCB2-198]|uniref:hypothetical protein n=1 Tax=Peredibacter sp. HCB2-198 TaxID=3383025 RepID=UPI0038B46CCE